MPTGNKMEQYYDLLRQHVSTFSTGSFRERQPLFHRIRPPVWGGQRGQGWTMFKLLFQVPCQSKQASQHRFILCSYFPGSFSSHATVWKDIPGDRNGKNRGGWRTIKGTGEHAYSDSFVHPGGAHNSQLETLSLGQ